MTHARPAPPWRRHATLCRLFVQQELRTRFSDSLLGAAWVFVAPLLQLAVYYVVFLHIFKARVPGLAPDAYLVFLALGFWPYTAFSEAVSRASTAIQDQAALAAKVAMPRALIVLARVLASFLIHGVGFIVVLLVLLGLGAPMHWTGLPLALLLWAPLLVLAIGAGLAAAAVQVFVRDLGQAIGPMLSLLFFLTPIVYALEMTPPLLHAILLWNPLTAIVEGQRAVLLFDAAAIPGWPALLVAVLLVPSAGLWLFRRLERWFEDYL